MKLMNKYATLFGLSWQKQLEVRSDFIFERARSLAILISLYFLWTALLQNQPDLLGYSREHLLTYVLLMTLLRAWVLGCVTDRIPGEIAKGKLSELLLRPISQIGFWATQDVASKSLNIVFAFVEVAVFSWLMSAPFFVPHSVMTWLWFSLSMAGGMVLYFEMSYLLGALGFWTSDSWGPRFCFETILEFCAGAYFPIDLLPAAAQKILSHLPFPYLIYYPVSIYLGRLTEADILSCFAHQLAWIAVLSVLVRQSWRAGLRRYAAEGG
jgi:ABC-2 type transport system permease protein